jgi:predicted Zn-dependent protease
LIVDLIVAGRASTVPVRWQHAGENSLGELERDVGKELIEEIHAARVGSFLDRPIQCNVVLAPFMTAQLIHECVGHTSEADNFLAYAQSTDVQLGYEWCRYPIQVYDDPTLAGRRGSYDLDDDGEPARCAHLIADGRWADLLADADFGRRLGRPAGHGRRVSGAPRALPRMSNTWMATGRDRIEHLIASVDQGLFCEGNWGGGSANLNFVVRPAFGRKIEAGKLTDQYVRRFDLVGNKFQAIASIEGVSNELRWFSPFNGCDKFGQNGLPVSFGAPAVLLRNALLRPIEASH